METAAASLISPAGVGLSAAALAAVFPFHFIVDRELQLVQTGPALRKIEPGELQRFSQSFAVLRPEIQPSYDQICAASKELFILQSRASGVRFRGQMLVLENTLVAFLGSPWLTSPAELEPLGLEFADIPLHDSLLDMLQLLQTQQMSYAEMEKLAMELRDRQEELQKANQALQNEMTVRARAEGELRATSRRLATLLGSLHGGILVEDERRRILHVNQAFCSLFSIPAEPASLIGADCAEMAKFSLALFEQPQIFLVELQRTLSERKRVLNCEVRLKNGRILSRDYVPVYIDDDYAGHLWHYSDITELRRAQEAQFRLFDELRGINQELNDFAYVVSHDLKAPLRGIASLASWLSTDYGDRLDDEGREHLVLLQSRVTRMNALIDGVLQYSRAGRLREDSSDIDLAELVADISDLLVKPPGVEVTVAPGLPCVRAERTRLFQIFQNLIGNAVKHLGKPTGRVEVLVRDEPGRWIFTVRDDGQGIDPKHHHRIFQLFQTLGSGSDSDSTGVGLAIVKRNVEISGGKVWLESSPGHGSSFHFTLPKSAAAPLPAEAALSAAAHSE